MTVSAETAPLLVRAHRLPPARVLKMAQIESASVMPNPACSCAPAENVATNSSDWPTGTTASVPANAPSMEICPAFTTDVPLGSHGVAVQPLGSVAPSNSLATDGFRMTSPSVACAMYRLLLDVPAEKSATVVSTSASVGSGTVVNDHV